MTAAYRKKMASCTGFGGGAYYNSPTLAIEYQDLIIDWINYMGYPHYNFICQKLSDCSLYSRKENTIESRLKQLSCVRTLAKIWSSCLSTLDTSSLDLEGNLVTSFKEIKASLLHTPNDVVNLNNAVLFTVSLDHALYKAKQILDDPYVVGSRDWVESYDLKDLKEFVKNNWHTQAPSW